MDEGTKTEEGMNISGMKVDLAGPQDDLKLIESDSQDIYLLDFK